MRRISCTIDNYIKIFFLNIDGNLFVCNFNYIYIYLKLLSTFNLKIRDI